MSIVLSQVNYHAQGREVLHALDLSLTERRIGLVGRNGSGKSSFLRLLAGLIAPSAGCVRVDELDPFRDRKAILHQLGIVFQNPDRQILFPSVGEELAFGLIQQGHSRAKAQELVRALLHTEGRPDWEEKLAAELSQGQRQWLCLQAVFLMNPATILLDEPFSGLDIPTQKRLWRRIEALAQRVIIAAHDPMRLRGVDRVLWLDEGRLRKDGPPAEVLPAFAAEMKRLGELDAVADLA